MEYEIVGELCANPSEIEVVHHRPSWRNEPSDRDPQRAIPIPDEEFA